MDRESDFVVVAVGYDGTEASRRAVDWAAAVAAPVGATLDLVHAVSLPPIPVQVGETTVDELLERHDASAHQALEAEQLRLAAIGVATRLALRRWLPAETLIEHARDARAGLLVVGQHGGRAERLLLGSVSYEVARDAETAVVVVRGERPSPPRKVLLAADGSAPSLRAAEAVARWFPSADVTAVHLRDRESALDVGELARALAGAGLADERLEIRLADAMPAKELLRIAEEETFDLVAAGRRGQSGWQARILGGVAEKLLHLSPCPVLLAH